MAQSPTDRGFACVRRDAGGTVSVLVCAAVEGGKPQDVFAMHGGVPEAMVELDPGVALAGTGRYRWTTRVVEVYAADGVVHLARPGGGFPS